jgi:hypothetical protein
VIFHRRLGIGLSKGELPYKSVRIHPIVTQLVDPALLEKIRVRPVGEAEGKGAGNVIGYF